MYLLENPEWPGFVPGNVLFDDRLPPTPSGWFPPRAELSPRTFNTSRASCRHSSGKLTGTDPESDLASPQRSPPAASLGSVAECATGQGLLMPAPVRARTNDAQIRLDSGIEHRSWKNPVSYLACRGSVATRPSSRSVTRSSPSGIHQGRPARVRAHAYLRQFRQPRRPNSTFLSGEGASARLTSVIRLGCRLAGRRPHCPYQNLRLIEPVSIRRSATFSCMR